MINDYKFANLDLKPSIFKELIVLLFDGKQFDRQTAISTIKDYHLQQGGIIQDNKNLIAVFKHATRLLKDMGLENRGYGVWRLNYEIKTITVVDKKNEKETSFIADKTIGKGVYHVYVYYYDTYKKLAEIQGKDVWPCKIGRTDTEPLQRIMSQAGTCFPESPHIALIINCHDSSKLETALHSILKYRDRHLTTAPGTEWFLTSPTEIEDLLNILD